MTSEATKNVRRAKEEEERQRSKANQPRKTDKFVTLIKVPGQKQPHIVVGDGFGGVDNEDELAGFLGRCGAFCLSASQALSAGKIEMTKPAGQKVEAPASEVAAEPPAPVDPNEAAVAEAKAKRLAELEADKAPEPAPA